MGTLLLVFSTMGPVNVDRSSEPRLEFSSGRPVSVGEWVDLRWTAGERITEMELLLTVEGEPLMSRCITPTLGPDCRHFLWQVPRCDRKQMQLRIRFNRDGHEIEGAPVAIALTRQDHGSPDAAVPMALPCATSPANDNRAPSRSNPHGGLSEEDCRTAMAEGDEWRAPLAHGRFVESMTFATATHQRNGMTQRHPFIAPRTVPLRT
ncbi:MAG: hypothetical protein ABIU54_06730 [Candidatus Eisenbacteria bacterium]